MNESLFENLGLSPNESKIYNALLVYGGSGVSTIALRAKIHRSNAYDSLRRLIEKGLVYEVLSQRETIYEAVDPHKLRELLEEKTKVLDEALPSIMKSFHKNLTPERAYIFKGLEGVKNYIRLAMQEGKDMYTLGGKGVWSDPQLQPFIASFMQDAKRKKMKLYGIFDYEVAKKIPHIIKETSTYHRIFPQNISTASAIDIFGDHIVTFTGIENGKISNDATIFVIVSSLLAESFRTWWQFIWDTLPSESSAKNGDTIHHRKSSNH